ncbi:MAG TPA: LytTR family DNA-binding domain-containing protein [Panacibacter sp.]|nr:LytTR family DNA-binding domain-containing protein [Panacibacter sp.]
MLKCFILDDEQHAIDVLTHYCKQTDYLQITGSSTNPVQALQMVNSQPVDILFIDIQMPDISGIDFVKSLHNRVNVIFTTAYSEFAATGFELEAVDYLLKPIPLPRFIKAVQKVLNTKIQQYMPENTVPFEDDYFFVKTEARGKMLKINMSEIDYIEGMKNYVAVYHNGQKTLALLNMKDLEEKLPEKYFMRVQKSYIVAVNKITGVEGNMIRVKNVKAEILMGDAYKAKVLAYFRSKIMG